MSREARKQEEAIKRKIVDGYRRGVCTHDGGDIPRHRRGMAGVGSHFIARCGPAYGPNYRRIFGHD